MHYRFDRFGCRGADRAIPPGPGSFRILALGGSEAFGVGVHEADTFSSKSGVDVERDDERGPAALSFEVVNCGVDRYDARQARLFYELFVAEYQPHLVLLAVAPSQAGGAEEGEALDPAAIVEEILVLGRGHARARCAHGRRDAAQRTLGAALPSGRGCWTRSLGDSRKLESPFATWASSSWPGTSRRSFESLRSSIPTRTRRLIGSLPRRSWTFFLPKASWRRRRRMRRKSLRARVLDLALLTIGGLLCVAAAAGSLDAQLQALRSRDAQSRADAARALGKLADSRAVLPLLTATADIDPGVRKACAEALTALGEPLGEVIRQSLEGSPEARRELARRRDPRAIDPLVGALRQFRRALRRRRRWWRWAATAPRLCAKR